MYDPGQDDMKKGALMALEYCKGVNDNMIAPHLHDYYEIYYLINGERYHFANGHFIQINPGELIVFPPYSMHHSYGEDNVQFERIVLYFSKKCLLFDHLLSRLDQGIQTYEVGDSVHPFFSLLFQEKKEPGQLSEEFQVSLLNCFLIEMLRSKNQIYKQDASDPFTEILAYINDHYMEDLNLENLAARFYMSPSYMSRKFKQAIQTNFVKYLQNVRIMHAQIRILDSEESLTDIAHQTGFSSLTSFNRVFKSLVGMTPSQYRKRNGLSSLG